jgi:hypothetical protein
MAKAIKLNRDAAMLLDTCPVGYCRKLGGGGAEGFQNTSSFLKLPRKLSLFVPCVVCLYGRDFYNLFYSW